MSDTEAGYALQLVPLAKEIMDYVCERMPEGVEFAVLLVPPGRDEVGLNRIVAMSTKPRPHVLLRRPMGDGCSPSTQGSAMNIETREIRPADELTDEERASGKWIPVARKYVQKQPISDADFARIMAAEDRRIRRAVKRALLVKDDGD